MGDIHGVIRSHQSKKCRKYINEKKKGKWTDNSINNTTTHNITVQIEHHETEKKQVLRKAKQFLLATVVYILSIVNYSFFLCRNLADLIKLAVHCLTRVS